MTTIETYLFLFADSFMASLILPIRYETVFPAMRIFGGYSLYIAVILSATGITLAAFLNWILGKLLRSLKKNDPATAQNQHLTKILSLSKKYGHFASILGFVPILGPIIIVLSGILSCDARKIIGIVFIVNIISHSLYVLL